MPDEFEVGEAASAKKGPPAPKNVRRWPRFKVDDEAAVVLYPEKLLNFVGLGKSNRAKAAVNLSEGGVLVRTGERIPRGTRVRLSIRLEKFSDHFDCAGVVRWCYQAARSDKEYYAGVAFVDLPPGDTKKIEKMRSWFTSPEYRAKTRFRQKPAGPDLVVET